MEASSPSILIHQHDLPSEVVWGQRVAIDTEAMGLIHKRDRLCLVQLKFEQGPCHLIQIKKDHKPEHSPNLCRLLQDPTILKIFHFARFDMGILRYTLGVMPGPAYCTKIASRFARTYTDRHGLKDVCRELLNVDISKEEQSSDWGADTLTSAQQRYAAQDVMHLHALQDRLDVLLEREGRHALAQGCFQFLATRVDMDLIGMHNMDPLNYTMVTTN